MSHLFHIVFVSVSIFRIVFNVCVLEVAVVERRRQCKSCCVNYGYSKSRDEELIYYFVN